MISLTQFTPTDDFLLMTQLFIERFAHLQTMTYYKQAFKNRSNKWQMKFNTSECHLLTITHKFKPSQFSYTISNQPVSRVNSHPCLGIIIDSKLSWTKHVQTTASKSAQTLGLLKRTLHPAKSREKEAAYNMLVRPRLEYGTSTTQNYWKLLEKKQISAARFALNDHRRTTSVTLLQHKLGWQSNDDYNTNSLSSTEFNITS